jgi:uncharacterized protein DUF3187
VNRLAWIIIWFAVIGQVTEAAQRDDAQGLVPVRNFQPVQGLSLQMPGESAVPIAPGTFTVRAHVAETATILEQNTPNVYAILKLNQLRTALEVRYGLFPDTEIGIELASLYNHSGGLDGLITATEHAIDKVSAVREKLKNTGFAYLLTRNQQTLLQGTNGAYGLTDLVLSSKTSLLAEGPRLPGVALRTAIKLPTGDQSRAFGTGVVDLGIGLVFQKALGEWFVIYQNLNEIFPTGHYLGFGLRAYFTSVSGLEWRLTPKFSITGQFDYYQAQVGQTGIKFLDRGITEAVLALGYRATRNLLWQLYGVQNLTIASGSDFTLATAVTYRFNH